jgi:hypothetical protein
MDPKTEVTYLGGPNWRIFYQNEFAKFSLVVQSPVQPQHEGIINFFNQHKKEFCIECESEIVKET